MTLFDIEGIMMTQLVKTTGYTEQTIRYIIKTINKDIEIINVDNAQKPYRYTVNIDVLSNSK